MIKTVKDYQLLQKLGQGTFGTVYKAKTSDNKIIALKIIYIDRNKKQLIELTKAEIEILKQLSTPTCLNPFIVCYYGSYYDETNEQFLIEMEYIEGTDMFDFVIKQPRSPTELYKYLLLITSDLMEGLSYIHTRGIIHNDIKLENIMIDKNFVPKIVDFGLACTTKDLDSCDAGGGTLYYYPPEYFQEKKRYYASDLWAVGIALYIAVTKQYPYESKSKEGIIYEIKHKEFLPINTSNKLLDDIINGLLIRDPKKRLTPVQVLLMINNYKPESKEQLSFKEGSFGLDNKENHSLDNKENMYHSEPPMKKPIFESEYNKYGVDLMSLETSELTQITRNLKQLKLKSSSCLLSDTPGCTKSDIQAMIILGIL